MLCYHANKARGHPSSPPTLPEAFPAPQAALGVAAQSASGATPGLFYLSCVLLPADGILNTLEDGQPKTNSKMAARAILVEKVPLQPSTPELRLLTGQRVRMTSPSGPPPSSGAVQRWGVRA